MLKILITKKCNAVVRSVKTIEDSNQKQLVELHANVGIPKHLILMIEQQKSTHLQVWMIIIADIQTN